MLTEVKRWPPKKRKGDQRGPRRISGSLAMDLHGAHEFTGFTEKSLRSKVARNVIPYRRLGGRIVFRRSELEAWFEQLPGVSLAKALENVAARRPE